ncbi:pyruvate kinase, partial [bacterium]|nr:pyruvate kinase [bacterium]
MNEHQRVKIVATIGPATNKYEVLKRAVAKGLDVARLNFSHGTHQDHKEVIDSVRKVSNELGHPVALLQDLQGPKIRVGQLKDGQMTLNEDDIITITNKHIEGDNLVIPVDFEGLPGAVSEGGKILFDDGLIECQVLSTSETDVKCKVVFGGVLKIRKGVNVPGADLPIDCMTPKDIEDLEFGISNNVDYVALSFVRRGSDIKNLKQIIEQKNPRIKVIAKIEMLEAIENLEEIIRLSDGVMVARGDLAVEVGQTRLPGLQKKIIKMANEYGKPVITATQMLDSMVNNPRPTRAEITDVANAVLDGTDALMLSAESASGKYPVECIATMSEISTEAEKSLSFYDINLDKEFLSVAESIGMSA